VTPPDANREAGDAPSRWRHYGFGLDVVSDMRVPQLPLGREPRNGLETRLTVLAPEDGAGWRYPRGDILIDRRHADGRLMIGVDRSDELGYRIWSPQHGRYAVSQDGMRIRAAVGTASAWKWQRLLFAQVLPLTAALRGFEVMHASAVAFDDRVVAFSASSGTGKTSTPLHMLSRGARFVTDDVLAVSVGDGEILAHPGAGVVSVASADVAGLNHGGQAGLGRVLGGYHKLQVEVRPVDRPLPLAALYVLERGNGARTLDVTHEDHAADVLLATAFIPYLTTPGHLMGHLDACARMSAEIETFHVRVPDGMGAGRVADELRAHIASVILSKAVA
jgi:hypothetical protein